MLFFQRYTYNPIPENNLSRKILVLISCVSALVIFSLYTTVITSEMTVQAPPPTINSLKEMQDQGYTLLLWEDSIMHEHIKSFGPGTREHIILQETSLVSSYQEAEDKMINDRKMAFLGSSEFLSFKVTSLRIQESSTQGVRMVFPNNSELTSMFNYHLRKMAQSGTAERLLKHWFPDKLDISEEVDEDDSVIVLSFENLILPVLILAGGCVCGFIVLMLELSFVKK